MTQHAQQALLSKQLATIDLNVPVAFDESKLLCSEPDKDTLTILLDELEFRSIKKRIFGEEIVAPPVAAKPKPAVSSSGQIGLFEELVATEEAPVAASASTPMFSDERKTVHSTLHHYHLINTPELRQMLVQHLSRQEAFCFDTETTAIDPIEADMVGMSFCCYKGEAYYVPVPVGERTETQQIVDEFKAVLENPAIEKIGQNLKYDMIVLKGYGVDLQGKLFDTMLAHYLLEPEQRHNMDVLAENYLNYYTPVSIESLIGKKGKGQLTMSQVELEKITEYAAEDADVTLQLKDIFEPMLKNNGLENLSPKWKRRWCRCWPKLSLPE